MRARHADRLWAIGGAVAAATLLAVGWFFLIGPQQSRTSALDEEVGMAQVRVATLQHKLVQLREQKSNLAEYRTELDRHRRALPATAEISDFLRELQDAGDAADVEVGAVGIGSPAEVPATTTKVYALPVSLTAKGRVADLDRFLHQIQQVQPRAVLIKNANATTTDPVRGFAGEATLNIDLQVFVAPGLSGKPGE